MLKFPDAADPGDRRGDDLTRSSRRFVDDVELYCDGKVIRVRSSSRLGYSDLGVNRKRVEAIRKAFGTA